MQNLGTRVKYTEQYCMFNTITASCSLGSKHVLYGHACMHTKLASQKEAHNIMAAKYTYP